MSKNIEQQLAVLLENPNQVAAAHTAMLNELLQEYPYYQPLHLLLAKANQQADNNHTLAKASLYTNGQLLHQFLFKTEKSSAVFHLPEEPSVQEEEIPVADEQETFEEISELMPVIPVQEEEQVFEEIAEVDNSNYRPFRNSDQPDGQPKAPQNQENHIERRHTTEDELVFESIVSADFFAFEQSQQIEKTAEPQQSVPFTVPVIEEHDEAAAAETENSRVSNYHDDKLPYTFLWWLAKTRKEHQSVMQPYATPKKGSSHELQQQYVEHIFHMQSHLTGNEELLDHPEQHKPASKDFEIIESFIRNDPQITPPNAEQIDNENKAKKSAEDQNDLVSETLASIYIEQMLYDKAIDTYEKLSLKFPEKSRYFADLIQSIEKKI